MAKIRALIDADNLIYHASWGLTSPVVDLPLAINKFDSLLGDILGEMFCDEYTLYIKAPNKKLNYRFEVCSEYKAKRSPPPPVLNNLSSAILERDNTVPCILQEADDAISIQAWKMKKEGHNYIVVSPDKDLNQIPGQHFDNYWTRRRHYTVTEKEADRLIYQQMLSGDPTDNIEGIKGIGEKTAKKLLDPCHTEGEMYRAVKYTWKRHHPIDWKEKMTKCARLVYIRRRENEIWTIKTHKRISKIW